ncbi:hypothetical protein [Gimesia sp.]|uniref:hypothetical protein n=1 Tax=Gimesia sp. TaxID=2024833 RepID=UPI003A8E98CD
MSDKLIDALYGIGCLLFVALFLWFMVKFGGAETPKQVKARKQREAEEFESMPDEVKQQHIHANNKVAEFHFSLIVFIITSAASGYLIYLCVK